MTSVIGDRPDRAYRGRVMATMVEEEVAVRDLVRGHQLLLDRAQHTSCGCPAAVLNLGLALRLQRMLERGCLEPIERLLDVDVLRRLAAESSRLIRAVDHLHELCELEAGSSDIEPLAAAVLDDLRAVLQRETNAIYNPLQHLYRLRRRGGGVAGDASQS
jgi:hypothetical protein